MLAAVSTDLMRKSDLATIEGGVTGIELMRRAAMGVYNSVKWNGKVAIISGSGNNAGDGYALALILKENGFACDIVLINEDRFSPDGKYYFHRCKKAEIRTLPWGKCDFSSYNIIVDCIFGTGFKGVPREPECSVIKAINQSGAYVVSVDINSGLNGDSGMYVCAVKSDITVSIGTLKSGHFLGMAKDVIERIVNCPIGIEIIDTPYGIFEDFDCKKAFKERKAFSNKGDYGYVALIGGCMEYSGAIKLANLALSSLKMGAGVVKLATGKSLYPSVSPYLVESTFYPLSDKDGGAVFVKEEIDGLLKGVRAVAIGMGMGCNEETYKIICHVLKNYSITVIIDADGLNAVSRYGADVLKDTGCNVVLTPHPKEFERLSGIPVKEVLNDPINSALYFARKNGCTVLLKGTSTVITDGKDVVISTSGTAGMATAGSGDVLSGILLGILSQGEGVCDTLTLVSAGAHINGKAGELAEKRTNVISMTSTDTVNAIADTVKNILKL
jgi:NAD(P)H-hydrate epimerase